MISLTEGPCGTQLAFPAPITTPIVTNGHSRLDGSNLQQTPNFSPLSHLPNDLNGGADSTCKSRSWNLGTHLDTPGKYQVVPRYRPKGLYKNAYLQNLSKEYPSCLIETLLNITLYVYHKHLNHAFLFHTSVFYSSCFLFFFLAFEVKLSLLLGCRIGSM